MDGQDLKIKFDEQWGIFRRFIAAKPLTGFYIGVAIGTVAGRFALSLIF